MNKVSNKIKDICNQLGKPYEIKTIDLEHVIYRDLGNGYDFEICGLDNQKKTFNANIYVWDIYEGKRTVETISGIKSFDMLKDCLEEAAEKYLKLRIVIER